MQIFVRTRSGRNLTVDVEAADDVSELRKKVLLAVVVRQKKVRYLKKIFIR